MKKQEQLALAWYATNARHEAGVLAENQLKDKTHEDHLRYPVITGVLVNRMQTIASALLNDKCPKWVVDEYKSAMKKVDEDMERKYSDYPKFEK